MKAIIIRNTKTKKYFAFINRFPGICAEADSVEKVKSKIKKHIKIFREMYNEQIEFELQHDF